MTASLRRLCVAFSLLSLLACSSLPAIKVEIAWPTPSLKDDDTEVSLPALTGEAGVFATPLPEAAQQGQSRVQPFPMQVTAETPGWEVRVEDVVKGMEAWHRLYAANQNNTPPPDGWEYLLVKVWVKCQVKDEAAHTLFLGLTGDRGVIYRPPGLVEPEPRLKMNLRDGETIKGWEAFLMPVDEGNRMLLFEELGDLADTSHYIAIDESPSIAVDLALRDIEPTELGTSLDAPAPFGKKVVAEDWEVTVLDVVWDDLAWERLADANQFNEEPGPGMTYALVWVRVRYIDIREGPVYISGWSFKAVAGEGDEYKIPSVVLPDPALNARLFPDGQFEGWVALELPEDKVDPVLVFDPSLNSFGYQTRYLSLVP